MTQMLTAISSFIGTVVSLLSALVVAISFKAARTVGYKKKRDLIEPIREKSAPIAAGEELARSDTTTCECLLAGKQMIITCDAAVSWYVFNGPSCKNYVQRPAEDDGLAALGMKNLGLIWNNDGRTWRMIRMCFQKNLGERQLEHAVSIVREECASLFCENLSANTRVKRTAVALNLLDMCRQITFRATIAVFFGIKSSDFERAKINENSFIAAIVAYFKAWEFFLFRSNGVKDINTPLRESHANSVETLQLHVRILLQAAEKHADNNRLFVTQLREACSNETEATALLEQSALEMLLAGTDTSSVTAYYALLGIAGDEGLQRDLRFELEKAGLNKTARKEAKLCPLLNAVVDETLRFKPVGPVVLRQAVKADPDFPGVVIKEGAAVLVHLAEMNLRVDYWKDPRTFNPRRFLQRSVTQRKVFFPFGDGPKGCIGMHLGRREVTAIVETVIAEYQLSIDGVETLGTLQTHWDIANQPDNPAGILVTPLNG